MRELAAARHGVRPDQVAVGHGAAELLQDACAQLCHDGELLVAWPGWRPLPDLAQRAGGTPVPVAGEGGIGPLADRVGADTRAVALSSPNDPTGAPVARADVRALCERVGERVWVLLDEAFADFLEPGEDAAALVAELPNLLVFRTFAKAHAMAGFRIGYVLAPTAELAERLTPSFSVNAPAQAAAAWALELGDGVARAPPRGRRARARAARPRAARHLAVVRAVAPRRSCGSAPTPTTPRRSPPTCASAASSSRPASAGATTATSASRCATPRRRTV